MRALLVSLGSIGRRHLANLRRLDPDGQVTVWRLHAPDGERLPPGCDADRVVYALEDALAANPEIALISGPASTHVGVAQVLAQHGVHLFVEKPLSDCDEGTEALIQTCHQRGLALLVAYPFRFYGPLRMLREAIDAGRIGRLLSVRAEVGQYLPDWRPGEDYRRSVSARRELGGGAELELSHELDIATWLAGDVESVTAWCGRLSDLELDVEDAAEILLQFRSGAVGSVRVDMIQRAPTRTCRVVGSEGTLTWDGATHEVRLFSVGAGGWSVLHPSGDLDRNEMYLAELKHFLDCARGEAAAEVTGEHARRVLQIALAAKRSAHERRAVAI
jgi:predicted dehydrogenase